LRARDTYHAEPDNMVTNTEFSECQLLET